MSTIRIARVRMRAPILLAATLWSFLALPALAEAPALRPTNKRYAKLSESGRARVDRFVNATPKERDAHRSRFVRSLIFASSKERRRLIARERRLWRAVPDAERTKIAAENDRFRRRYRLPMLDPERDLMRDLGFSAADRRLFRAQLRKLPKDDQKKLTSNIERYRDLDSRKRTALEARVRELKGLGEEARKRRKAVIAARSPVKGSEPAAPSPARDRSDP